MLDTGTGAGLAAALDWRSTDLGERALWPHTLRLTIDILLAAPCPMLLVWGPRRVVVFNAAYSELAGPLHPRAPGAKVPSLMPAPMAAASAAFERAAQGEFLHLQQQMLTIPGPQGSTQLACDLELVPLADDTGAVQGVLCALSRSPECSNASDGACLRVLVVEDNLDSQYLVCEMLKAFGHAADGVSHAEGALSKLAGANYDVLFSDVSLPGMSGVDLARQALRTHPAMRVIFASGYGEGLLRHVEFPFQSLQKPYELDQLQAALAAAALPHA